MSLTQQQRLLVRTAQCAMLSGKINSGRLQIRFTPALRQLLSVPRTLPGGPLLNSRLSAADRPLLVSALARLIELGEPIDLRYQVHTDNQLRDMHLLLERHAEQPQRVVGVLRAVSDAEAKATGALLTLAHIHEVDRAASLGELASTWAHELNQPLAAVTTFAQAAERLLAQADFNREKIQKVCHELSSQALRAGEVMKRMRSLLKPPAEQRETVSCRALIDDFALLAMPMAQVQQVGFHVRQQNDAQVSVDVASLQRVLLVLLANALDAVQGQPVAEVTLVTRLIPEGIEIALLDSGPGVGATFAGQLPRALFSTKPNGLGLGLSTCQKWLERHGSGLILTNRPEGGCCAVFVLPVASS